MAGTMKKLGLIINPIAGMGGSVGLKGTDGVLDEAIARGAMPHATEKTLRALRKLLQDAEAKHVKLAGAESTKKEAKGAEKLTIITCGGDMGETALLEFIERPLSDTKFLEKESSESASSESDFLKPELSYEVAYISPNAKTSASLVDTANSNSERVEFKNTTDAEDTKAGARAIASAGADIIAFVGGDGTARDIYEAIGESLPVLGIPAGVKIYSPVYAQSPEKAGELLRLYLHGQTTLTKEAEVLDINEDDYRRDIINTRLFGYLRVPYERRFLQSRKAPSPMSEESRQRSIAAYIAEELMRDTSQDTAQNNANNADSAEAEDKYYIIGPGSTTRSLADYLGVENTLLGVDIVLRKQTATKTIIKTVAKDVSEQEILAYLETMSAESTAELTTNPTASTAESTAELTTNPTAATAESPAELTTNPTAADKVKLIITPTGGQGYLLGRGNQQISSRVIKKIGKNNIFVIATSEKLAGLFGSPLRIDTGDFEADELLKGYVRVVTGYREIEIYAVE